MYKILIVAALSQELAIIKKSIKKLNFSGLNIEFLQTGMGNYNMIFNLTKKLEEKDYDFVLNIGICGLRKFTKNDNFEDFYQVGRIIDIFNQKEFIIPKLINFGKIATCLSSNDILYKIEKKANVIKKLVFKKGIYVSDFLYSDNFILVDMESFGFEFVLEKYNLPRLILKVPVDFQEDDLKTFDYKLALNYLETKINYFQLLASIKSYLEKQKKNKINLDKYFNKLIFSERQKEIFEFLYRKYQVLIGDDFDVYFENYIKNLNTNNLSKKHTAAFLKKIEDRLKLL